MNLDINNDTNDLQYGGSCTLQAITNQMETMYYTVSGIKISINADVIWKYRNDVLGIPASMGGSFSSTFEMLVEFQNKFGGLPCTDLTTMKKGIVKIGKLDLWGSRLFLAATQRVDNKQKRSAIKTHSISRKLDSQLRRGYGAIFAMPVGSTTFNECKIGKSGILRFDGAYDSSHAMAITGYLDKDYRIINPNTSIIDFEYKRLAPEFYIVSNSWGNDWGHKRDGTCLLRVDDIINCNVDFGTVLPHKTFSINTESYNNVFGTPRFNKMSESILQLKECNAKNELKEFYDIK